MLLIVIAVTALIDHLSGLYKERRQSKKLSNFLSRFEGAKRSKDYKNVLELQPDSVNALILLTNIYYKSGDFAESIKICLALLDILTDENERVFVMTRLAGAYYKAGFLQRSRDILLESLRLKNRNLDALKLLLVIYEQMKEYKSALDVLTALRELEEDVLMEREFIQANIVISDALLSAEKKFEALRKMQDRSPFLHRLVAEFMFSHDHIEAWSAIKSERLIDTIDIFWFLPRKRYIENEALKHPLLRELYTAKGWQNSAAESGIFEFDLLIRLKENKPIVDVEFEYRCEKCYSLFPMHFYRCPKCQKLGVAAVEMILAKKSAPLRNDAEEINFD
jgi:lipopolysaccharide biosynthesis regulator YciM